MHKLALPDTPVNSLRTPFPARGSVHLTVYVSKCLLLLLLLLSSSVDVVVAIVVAAAAVVVAVVFDVVVVVVAAAAVKLSQPITLLQAMKSN